jgi:hypothetical protein
MKLRLIKMRGNFDVVVFEPGTQVGMGPFDILRVRAKPARRVCRTDEKNNID